MERIRVSRIKGYYQDLLIVDKKARVYDKGNIENIKERIFQRYRKLGVKLDYIDLVYKSIDDEKFEHKKGNYKVPPNVVYDYMKNNPDKSLVDTAIFFNISKNTVSRYVDLVIKGEV